MNLKLLLDQEQLKIQKGFTLVELLFVVVLLSILSLSVMKIVTQMEASSSDAKVIRERVEVANRVFSELRTLLTSRGNKNIHSSINPASSQPQVGFANTRQNLILLDTNESNNILRISTNGSRYASAMIPQLYGDVEARIFIDNTKDQNNKNLILEFWPILNPQEQNNLQNNQPIVRKTLCSNVENISYRFRQQNKWVNDLSSYFGSSPTLIEIKLEISSPEAKKDIEIFKTAIPFGPPQR